MKVFDLINIAEYIPSEPEREVKRENLVSTIKHYLNQGIEIISVEGEDGYGKTTLLSQFARDNPKNTFSLFVRSVSRVAYDPQYIKYDLYNQLVWSQKGVQYISDGFVDDALIRQALIELHRKASRKNQIYYFVIDGLTEIPKEENHHAEIIFQLLPLGMPRFKFIFTGEIDRFLKENDKKIKHKSFPIVTFNYQESCEYLNDVIKERGQLETIYKIWGGVPGNLASIRRIILSGTDAGQLINDAPDAARDLFEFEWNMLGTLDNDEKNILGIIAFDKNKRTIDSISLMLSIDKGVVNRFVEKLSFICSENQNKELRFVSEGFRKFVENKLIVIKDEITNRILQFLKDNPNSSESLIRLPEIYKEKGEYKELVTLLTHEHFCGVIKQTQSLRSVVNQIGIGRKAAFDSNLVGPLFDFSIAESVVRDLDAEHVYMSEVSALLSIGEYDNALIIANSSTLIDERLILLSLVVRSMRKEGKEPEVTLIEQIDRLCQQLDVGTISKNNLLNVASELFSVNANKAIELLEKSAEIEGGENGIDEALVKITINALQNEIEIGDEIKSIESIKSKISNKNVTDILDSAAVFVSPSSIGEMIDELEKIPKVGDRLFMLRRWLTAHKENPFACQVIEYAIKEAIGTTEYAPNAGFYKDIASPLPYVSDENKVKEIVKIFDGQKGLIEEQGPLQDYVRLQLIIAEAEAMFDKRKAKDRLIGLYLDTIVSEDNLIVQGECLAWFDAAIHRIDRGKEFEEEEGIFRLIETDLNDCIDKILVTSAEHYETTKNILAALAADCISFAIDIVNRLNTKNRRNRAIVDLSAARINADEIDVGLIVKLIGRISDNNKKDEVVGVFLDRINNGNDVSSDVKLSSCNEMLRIVRDVELKCKVLVSKKKYEIECGLEKDAREEIDRAITQSWDAIPEVWNKVDAAFGIASTIGKTDVVFAKKWIACGEELRSEVIAESETFAQSLILLISLSIRAYNSLIACNEDNDSDLESLEYVIDKIPSPIHKVSFWSKVVCNLYTKDRIQSGKDVYREKIERLFDEVSMNDKKTYANMVVTAAPALWCAHKKSALEKINGLDSEDKNVAVWALIEFVLRKQFPSEPFDVNPGHSYKINYHDGLDIIEIMSFLEEDSIIYITIKRVVESILKNKKDGKLTLEQCNDLALRMNELVNRMLPSSEYIKHDGFKIAAKSHILRISSSVGCTYEELIASAKTIPNKADSGFLMTLIADALPAKRRQLKIELLNISIDTVDDMSALYDQLERLEYVAETSWGIDTAISNKCLREAIHRSQKNKYDDDETIVKKQKDLVELAYRINPDFASSFVSATDNDPARMKNQDLIKKQIDFQKLKKQLVDEKEEHEFHGGHAYKLYAKAAWKQLAGLNAGRITPVHINRVKGAINYSAGYGFVDTYPLFAWSIENLGRTYANTNQAREYLRPLFDSLINNVKFVCDVITSVASDKKREVWKNATKGDGSSISIGLNERDRAEEFIKRWLLRQDSESIRICDPYFGPDDLDIVKIIMDVYPNMQIYILTSYKYLNQLKAAKPWSDTFVAHWKKYISEQDPPETEILVAGLVTTGDLPIHDRWLLSDSGGLSVGTSFNSLGRNRLSMISELSESDAFMTYERIGKYFLRKEKVHNGDKIKYELFNL